MSVGDTVVRMVVRLVAPEGKLQFQAPRSGESFLYECRNCGATLKSVDARCSTCESSDVAVFEF